MKIVLIYSLSGCFKPEWVSFSVKHKKYFEECIHFYSCPEHKEDILKNVGNQTVAGP